MIEPTDEMVEIFMAEELRLANDGGGTKAVTRGALAAVLAIVGRDYDVRRRVLSWPPGRGALHPHFCVTCSDGAKAGPGCINCRSTGFDQSPWPDCEQCRRARSLASA